MPFLRLHPEVINRKERVRDREIDTIIGKNKRDAIVTICERKTKMAIIHKLDEGHKAEALPQTVFLSLLAYKDKVHSITSDNGDELLHTKKLRKA